MAVHWRRRHGPNSLETQLWKTFQLDGKNYLIKGLFGADSYRLLVTDFGQVWEETLGDRELLERSKSLNPFVDAPLSVILQQLSGRMESPQHYTFKLEVASPTQFVLLVEGPLQVLSGPHYQWKYICSSTDPDMLSAHLLTPLMSVTAELLRRQQELVSILVRKDREIKDYRESGAVVSRKHLQTVPFDMKKFNNEMMLSQGFEDSANHPLKILSSPDWHELYKDVAMKHWTLTRPGSSSEGGDGEITSTNETWAAKLPPSVVTGSPSSSPIKSPQKRRTQDSAAKDEKSRRDALEKQLEESKAKGRKKKRKLM